MLLVLGALIGLFFVAAIVDTRDHLRDRRARRSRARLQAELWEQVHKRNAQHRGFKFPANWVTDDRTVPYNKLKQPS